jgi:endonuclease-3
MRKPALSITEILDQLERFHGEQSPCWPTDPYQFLVWWHCGYPASDAACIRGWKSLTTRIGTAPEQILSAGTGALTEALRPGGMVPELRAMRLLEIAARVQNEYAGDLRAALQGPVPRVRAALKRFPNIADPGADRILLFGGVAPVAAIPSNCPHVLLRIRRGWERENYGVNYREAQQALEAEVPAAFDARQRAYLLLKRHGQDLCKSGKPKCSACPIQPACAFFARSQDGVLERGPGRA